MTRLIEDIRAQADSYDRLADGYRQAGETKLQRLAWIACANARHAANSMVALDEATRDAKEDGS